MPWTAFTGLRWASLWASMSPAACDEGWQPRDGFCLLQTEVSLRRATAGVESPEAPNPGEGRSVPVSALQLGLDVASKRADSHDAVLMIVGFCCLLALLVLLCLACERCLQPEKASQCSAHGHEASRAAQRTAPFEAPTFSPGTSPSSTPEIAGGLPSQGSVLPSSDLGRRPKSSSRTSSSRSECLTSAPPASPPPAICPSLVLPVEASFAVPSVQGVTTGAFDILGLAGERLLCALIRYVPENRARTLEIAVPSAAGSCAVATCRPSSEATEFRRGSLELRDVEDRLFGRLECTGEGRYTVVQGTATLMVVSVDQARSHISMRLPSGHALASATRCAAGSLFYKFDHYEVWVNPGQDAILALTCLLAILVFQSG